MADSIPSDVLSFLRTRFRSRSITIGLPPDGKAGPLMTDSMAPTIDRLNGRTLEAIRQAGAVPAACVLEADFVAFLESRSYDPCEIIDELMARKLVSHITLELLPPGESGPIPPGVIAQEKDLGVAHPAFLPGLHRFIAVHADIMDTRPTPGTSGRGQAEGAGVGSQMDGRQGVEGEADGVPGLSPQADADAAGPEAGKPLSDDETEILRLLAGKSGPQKAGVIAGKVGVSERHLRRRAGSLADRGLVAAAMGPTGGYSITDAGKRALADLDRQAT